MKRLLATFLISSSFLFNIQKISADSYNYWGVTWIDSGDGVIDEGEGYSFFKINPLTGEKKLETSKCDSRVSYDTYMVCDLDMDDISIDQENGNLIMRDNNNVFHIYDPAKKEWSTGKEWKSDYRKTMLDPLITSDSDGNSKIE